MSIVLDVGCDVGRQSPDSICDKSKSGAYRTVELVVCTENLIRVDDVESPKLAE